MGLTAAGVCLLRPVRYTELRHPTKRGPRSTVAGPGWAWFFRAAPVSEGLGFGVSGERMLLQAGFPPDISVLPAISTGSK